MNRAEFLYKQSLEYAAQDSMKDNFYTNFYAYKYDDWLYFIEEPLTKHIKIGWAKNLNERIKCLQIGCPTKLRLLWALKIKDKTIERKVHKELKNSRATGEWFLPTDEVYEFLNAAIRFCFDGTRYSETIRLFEEE